MSVPVVNIRHVGVLVLQFFMSVPVRVLFKLSYIMRMVMMPIIMAMPVFVIKHLMPVQMHMVFPED